MDLLEGREAWRVPFFTALTTLELAILCFIPAQLLGGLMEDRAKNKKWLFQFLLLVSSFADRFANTKAVRSTTLLLHSRFRCVLS